MSPLNAKDEQRLYGYESQSRGKQKFTDEEIVKALTAAHQANDGTLTRAAYQDFYAASIDKGLPHPYTIIRRHGKWSDAMRIAGLPTNTRTRYSNRVSKVDCLRALRVAREILGHLPSVTEYSKLWNEGTEDQKPLKDRGFPAEGTIRLRFDRWKLALKELEGE